MTLYEGQTGMTYRIEDVQVEQAITRRLEALGLNDDTLITVLNRKNKGAMVIKVRGTRLALGKHITEYILVEETADEH